MFAAHDQAIEKAIQTALKATLHLRDMRFVVSQGILELRDPLVVEAEQTALLTQQALSAAKQARHDAEALARSHVLAARRDAAEAAIAASQPDLVKALAAAQKAAACLVGASDEDKEARRARWHVHDCRQRYENAVKAAMAEVSIDPAPEGVGAAS